MAFTKTRHGRPTEYMQAHCIHTGKQADKQNKKTENNNVTQDKVITWKYNKQENQVNI